MADEKRELYREGVVVEVEKTDRGYAVGVKEGSLVEYFFSEKPLEKGKKVVVFCVYGKKTLRSRFEILVVD
ncbi:MAG: hypothetical protein QFX33_02600 [Candidatus Nezhaarchaeota archaeon]|nr:hypothetical protein [Candidatus Nezhaarchaeota archaeon]